MSFRTAKRKEPLAYFTIFSLPGLLIIIIWISTIFYGREVVEGSLYGQMENFIGHDAAMDMQKTIRNARVSSAYGAAGSVIVMLLWVHFSAMILYLGPLLRVRMFFTKEDVSTQTNMPYGSSRLKKNPELLWMNSRKIRR